MNEALQLAPTFLAQAAEHAEESGGGEHAVTFWGYFLVTVLIAVAIVGILAVAKKGYNGRVFKNAWSSRAEQLYLFLENFALGIIGPHGKKYMPMMATFWLFIFVSNLVALFFPYSPTADLSSNFGLSILAVMYVQWEGIRANGVGGHFKHFSGPRLGGMLVLVSGMIFIIEIISETMKMLSLSLRLYGNIHGGHEVVMNLNNLGRFPIAGHEVAIPLGALLLPIKLLTVIVQALVFTLLFSVYVGLVTHHEEEHGSHHEPGTLTAGDPHALDPQASPA